MERVSSTTMNGNYIYADSEEERVAIAIVACNEDERIRNPRGVLPGYDTYREWIRPFIRREIIHALLQKIHKGTKGDVKYEAELAAELIVINKAIGEKLHVVKEGV